MSLRRSKPLKADPEKTREWLVRSRAKRPAKRVKRIPPRPTGGALTPLEWREAVWHLCEGRCIATGVYVPIDAESWTWNAHHCIKSQSLKRHSISPTADPRAGVVLHTRAHEAHTTRAKTIPYEALPLYVVEYAAELGPWAELALEREHPKKN